MAQFILPPGGDPTTIAWLRLNRRRRRAARAGARRYLLEETVGQRIRGEPTMTKAQRRQATPWQPIVVPPGDAHFLSGNMSVDQTRLILLGLNRRERRALAAKSGPRGGPLEQMAADGALGGHVTRSSRRILPLLSKAHVYARAESTRRSIADAQGFAKSFKGRALKGLVTAAAVPMVAYDRIKRGLKGLFGGGS